MEADVLMSLAGEAAQRQFSQRSIRSWHGSSDRQHATNLVSRTVGSVEEQDAYMTLLWVRTKRFVALPHIWTAIVAVAERLVEQRRLGRTELRKIIRETLGSPLSLHATDIPRSKA
jgi:hypothetical protein